MCPLEALIVPGFPKWPKTDTREPNTCSGSWVTPTRESITRHGHCSWPWWAEPLVLGSVVRLGRDQGRVLLESVDHVETRVELENERFEGEASKARRQRQSKRLATWAFSAWPYSADRETFFPDFDLGLLAPWITPNGKGTYQYAMPPYILHRLQNTNLLTPERVCHSSPHVYTVSSLSAL